ncbi:hypothetical protein ACGH2B_26450 [Streptomyces sp. BBFR2]|uniref:hypothetical protein n=1 Tax=Streptomyces sp. BBFR2 TaxID=3372854 RepID=UPI0037DA3256
MIPFDALELERRYGRRSPGQVLLLTLIVVSALLLVWRVVVFGALEAHFGSGYDDRRFDVLETQFNHRQTAFAKADARMREVLAPTRGPNGSAGARRRSAYARPGGPTRANRRLRRTGRCTGLCGASM